MKKNILLIVSVLAIALVIIYCIYSSVISQRREAEKTVSVLISSDIIIKNEVEFESSPEFNNPATKQIVSFKPLVGTKYQSSNSTIGVYLNGALLGQVVGQALSLPSFSRDNKYFAFRVRSVCGATCQNFSIELIDLTSAQMSTIPPPRSMGDYNGKSGRLGYEVFPFIESYSWGTDNIELVFYFIGTDGNAMSRVSAREIWTYNLSSKQYALIQSIPD